MSMGVHHPYHLDLCADDEDPSQLIIRPGWDAPQVRCFPRMFCDWPCLLRQVGMVLVSPYDYVVAGLEYANPGSRQTTRNKMAIERVFLRRASDMIFIFLAYFQHWNPLSRRRDRECLLHMMDSLVASGRA